MKKIFLFFVTTIICLSAFSQYTVNGDATQDNCHCYTLTQNIGDQHGSVWNNTRINLNQSFDFSFQVKLGCVDGNGADGIAFVLQPTSTSVGTTGGGMGYQFVAPAVGVTLDTYQNSSPDNDPWYDHIAIQLNGDINHNSAACLTPLTPISATSNNVEDCQNHVLRVTWDAVTKTMTVYFDNQLRVSAVNDFTNTIFGGSPLVYWGFTGATGGLSNLQQFCTTLTPSFHFLPGQRKCINEAITFFDSTISFSEPVVRTWDFGDGSPVVTGVVNPTHTFTTTGDHTVVLTVTSPDGCVETFTQNVFIGSKPLASFSSVGNCITNAVYFNSTSTVAAGTINSWYWDFDNNGITSTAQYTNTNYTTPGVKFVKLLVKTVEGCISDTLVQPVSITGSPTVDFSFTDSVCLGTPTSFHDLSSISFGTVNYWQWSYGDSAFPATAQHPQHVFTTAGPHQVTLVTSASGTNACAGTSVTHTVFVADKPVAKMKAATICERQSFQLQDSSYSSDGLAITQCWWDIGNGQFSNQCNPTVTYNTPGPIIIRHVVRNARGCLSDTMNVTLQVADKPMVNFGFPAPVCRDTTLQLHDSSTVNNGNVNQWYWIYNGSNISSSQHPEVHFPFGPRQVGLSVTSNLGCFSDTIYKSFTLIKEPKLIYQFNDTCKYDPVSFFAAENPTNIGITEWHWTFGDGSVANTANASHTYNANGQYNISLFAISTEGCSSDTLRDVVNIYGTNAFAGNDTIAAAGQPVQLHASGGVSYIWSPTYGLNNTNVSNPVATNDQDMTYYLEAYTPAGCKSFDTINIVIYKGPEIYIPSAFTPNNDGLNDVLHILPIGMKRFDYFRIYNRFGQLIFTSNNKDKGWDGTFKGARQPAGNYVYILSGTDFTGKPLFRKGSVLLIR